MTVEVPTISVQFNSAMVCIEAHLPKEQRVPEQLMAAMRNMFFAGAAAVIHSHNHIADIQDDDLAVQAMNTLDKEIHDEARKLTTK